MRLTLQYTVFPSDPSISEDIVRGAVDTLNADRPPDNQISVTFDQAATNRFVEAAKKQLGF
ncbi:MAG: hypothetical protein HYX89_07920 [Chloroflexi bacterium]|nr:hypothetical protein [Chloroflexota bacterium]